MFGFVLQINDPDPYIWIVSKSFCHTLELVVTYSSFHLFIAGDS